MKLVKKAGIIEEQLDSLPLSAFPTIDKQMMIEHFDEIITVSDLRQEDLRKFDAETEADRRPRIIYIAATDGRYGGAMVVGDGIDGVGARQMYLDIKTPLKDWIDHVRKFKPNIIASHDFKTGSPSKNSIRFNYEKR